MLIAKVGGFLRQSDVFKSIKSNFEHIPPHPIIGWGTCMLEAASYYCKYFNEKKSLVQELDPDEAVSIKISQNICN